MNPLVSIIIPCHDHGRFLAEAIRSALGQTHQPVEVIVVDDGSTDDSADVARSFADRVRMLRRPQGGPAAARNTGARASSGEYGVFLDADDILEDSYVARTLSLLRRRPELSYVYTQMRLFGAAEGVTAHPDFDLQRLKVGGYIHASALMRAGAIREVPFDESFRGGWEDWDLYLTLAERGHRGALLDEPLLRYRKHGGGSRDDQLLRGRAVRKRLIFRIYAKHRRLYGASDWVRFALKYLVYSLPPLYALVQRRRADA